MFQTEGSGYIKTDASYSGGTCERFYNGSRSYTIPAEAGCYNLEIKVPSLDGTNNRGVTIKVAGTTLASYNTFNVGTHTVPFVMPTDNATLGISKGYNGTNYIDYVLVRRVSTISTALGTNGYATFASPYPLDLTTANLPTGLTAYKASVSGSTVTFTALNQTVPANTGILLQGGDGETYNIPVVASGTDVTGNAFLVNTAGTTFSPGDTETYYYFGLKKNTLTFGTFDPSTVAIPANKAYLRVLKSSITGGARLNISFGDDETTGVADVRSKMANRCSHKRYY